MNQENPFKPWKKKGLPKKILAIRLQALGDTVIALSYLQYLREQLPAETQIDFLVRNEFDEIPANLQLFNTVYSLSGGNKIRNQFIGLLPHLFKIKKADYDVVLDLQNNIVSNFVRAFVNPLCYVRFDRFSSKHACQRNAETINKAGVIQVKESYHFNFKNPNCGSDILEKNGWKKGSKLILLNPAGAFSNRNWPTQNYIDVANQLINEYDSSLFFLLLGTEKIAEKAKEIKKALGDKVITLINQTSQIEVLAIVQETCLCITEDGALMHMAYLSGKKTIGLLGSSRSDWHNPKLAHTFCFTSDDLECGNCMLSTCKFHTNFCMTRISSEHVYEKAVLFLNSTKSD